MKQKLKKNFYDYIFVPTFSPDCNRKQRHFRPYVYE